MNNIHFKEGYVIRNQYAPHFLTFAVCGWIDLFTRKVYKDILIDGLKYAQKQQQLILYAYLIMINHMHLIAMANEKQKKTLSDIVRDFKKFTHCAMMPVIESDVESRQQWMLHQFKHYGSYNPNNEMKQIWTNDNQPEQCFTKVFTDVKLQYIHENALRAGIVANAEDYIYSSAANYVGRKGIIDVELI